VVNHVVERNLRRIALLLMRLRQAASWQPRGMGCIRLGVQVQETGLHKNSMMSGCPSPVAIARPAAMMSAAAASVFCSGRALVG
jgi:hypothetical protein